MKNLLYLVAAILLFSCNSKEKKMTQNENINNEGKELYTHLYASWVGIFNIEERDTTKLYIEEPTLINILIKKITESEVTGQRIIAGKSRPLKGSVRRTGNTFYFTLKEPGDDKNDGTYNFEIKNDSILVGTWTANDPKKEVTKRSYTLSKKVFKYDPNVMLPEEIYVDFQNPKEPQTKIAETVKEEKAEKDTLSDNDEDEMENDGKLYRTASDIVYTINSSTTKLKESQLKNLKKIELEILRNTIFARHGFAFKSKTIRQFFDYVDWYIPLFNNVDDKLTETERQNITILKRFEKYAEDNYDTFGR
ncbi:YARHG domain-containing protein [Flavobacterium sp. KACC 22761]|uniref:YARHG domain-containing protein n=1 Tax=Flavobacterium sp. KACC 22761 TaxID=3092665 RepID=UPI002A765A19|nr:YARHG domain-containing protein [Flavobacterium sp. KACC 22761]WPO79113.1 YARHG domain-containing protein [Flavobacterium sp. KACC 22761]